MQGLNDGRATAIKKIDIRKSGLYKFLYQLIFVSGDKKLFDQSGLSVSFEKDFESVSLDSLKNALVNPITGEAFFKKNDKSELTFEVLCTFLEECGLSIVNYVDALMAANNNNINDAIIDVHIMIALLKHCLALLHEHKFRAYSLNLKLNKIGFEIYKLKIITCLKEVNSYASRILAEKFGPATLEQKHQLIILHCHNLEFTARNADCLAQTTNETAATSTSKNIEDPILDLKSKVKYIDNQSLLFRYKISFGVGLENINIIRYYEQRCYLSVVLMKCEMYTDAFKIIFETNKNLTNAKKLQVVEGKKIFIYLFKLINTYMDSYINHAKSLLKSVIDATSLLDKLNNMDLLSDYRYIFREFNRIIDVIIMNLVQIEFEPSGAISVDDNVHEDLFDLLTDTKFHLQAELSIFIGYVEAVHVKHEELRVCLEAKKTASDEQVQPIQSDLITKDKRMNTVLLHYLIDVLTSEKEIEYNRGSALRVFEIIKLFSPNFNFTYNADSLTADDYLIILDKYCNSFSNKEDAAKSKQNFGKKSGAVYLLETAADEKSGDSRCLSSLDEFNLFKAVLYAYKGNIRKNIHPATKDSLNAAYSDLDKACEWMQKFVNDKIFDDNFSNDARLYLELHAKIYLTYVISLIKTKYSTVKSSSPLLLSQDDAKRKEAFNAFCNRNNDKISYPTPGEKLTVMLPLAVYAPIIDAFTGNYEKLNSFTDQVVLANVKLSSPDTKKDVMQFMVRLFNYNNCCLYLFDVLFKAEKYLEHLILLKNINTLYGTCMKFGFEFDKEEYICIVTESLTTNEKYKDMLPELLAKINKSKELNIEDRLHPIGKLQDILNIIIDNLENFTYMINRFEGVDVNKNNTVSLDLSHYKKYAAQIEQIRKQLKFFIELQKKINTLIAELMKSEKAAGKSKKPTLHSERNTAKNVQKKKIKPAASSQIKPLAAAEESAPSHVKAKKTSNSKKKATQPVVVQSLKAKVQILLEEDRATKTAIDISAVVETPRAVQPLEKESIALFLSSHVQDEQTVSLDLPEEGIQIEETALPTILVEPSKQVIEVEEKPVETAKLKELKKIAIPPEDITSPSPSEVSTSMEVKLAGEASQVPETLPAENDRVAMRFLEIETEKRVLPISLPKINAIYSKIEEMLEQINNSDASNNIESVYAIYQKIITAYALIGNKLKGRNCKLAESERNRLIKSCEEFFEFMAAYLLAYNVDDRPNSLKGRCFQLLVMMGDAKKGYLFDVSSDSEKNVECELNPIQKEFCQEIGEKCYQLMQDIAIIDAKLFILFKSLDPGFTNTDSFLDLYDEGSLALETTGMQNLLNFYKQGITDFTQSFETIDRTAKKLIQYHLFSKLQASFLFNPYKNDTDLQNLTVKSVLEKQRAKIESALTAIEKNSCVKKHKPKTTARNLIWPWVKYAGYDFVKPSDDAETKAFVSSPKP